MTGYRTWADEDRLTADDVNGYLMPQCVPRFATGADRDAAMGAIDGGQLTYLDDTGLQMYTPAGTWATLFTPAGATTPATLTFGGTWDATLAYPTGTLVKRSGGVYVATAPAAVADDPAASTSGNWTSLL